MFRFSLKELFLNAGKSSPSFPHAPIPEVAFLRSTLPGALTLFYRIPLISPYQSKHLQHPKAAFFLRNTWWSVLLSERRSKKEPTGVPDLLHPESNSAKLPFCGYEKVVQFACTKKEKYENKPYKNTTQVFPGFQRQGGWLVLCFCSE